VLLATAFIVTDCSAGRSKVFSAYVGSRRYVPARTDVQVHHDKDHTWTTVSQIPEEWHIYFQDRESDRVFDVKTDSFWFHSLTNGQDATISARVGKWTKAAYLPSIVSTP